LGPDLISLGVGVISVVITRVLDVYLPGKVEPACLPGHCWLLLRPPGAPTSLPPTEEK
jgi:hypothetical protein